jgi:hypothetical protein
MPVMIVPVFVLRFFAKMCGMTTIALVGNVEDYELVMSRRYKVFCNAQAEARRTVSRDKSMYKLLIRMTAGAVMEEVDEIFNGIIETAEMVENEGGYLHYCNTSSAVRNDWLKIKNNLRGVDIMEIIVRDTEIAILY